MNDFKKYNNFDITLYILENLNISTTIAIVLQKERETTPEDLIKCTVCSALFYNKKAYNIHNAYHQPDDLYVTSEEQRMQTVTKIDQDFDIRRVETMADRYIPRSNVFKKVINHRTEVKHMLLHVLSLFARNLSII